MATSPEVAALFRQTNFTRQKKMLQMSLNLLIARHGKRPGRWLPAPARRQAFARQLDIEPKHYVAWLNSLMKAVKQHDPKYRPELEHVWRSSLKPGIDLIKARY